MISESTCVMAANSAGLADAGEVWAAGHRVFITRFADVVIAGRQPGKPQQQSITRKDPRTVVG